MKKEITMLDRAKADLLVSQLIIENSLEDACLAIAVEHTKSCLKRITIISEFNSPNLADENVMKGPSLRSRISTLDDWHLSELLEPLVDFNSRYAQLIGIANYRTLLVEEIQKAARVCNLALKYLESDVKKDLQAERLRTIVSRYKG